MLAVAEFYRVKCENYNFVPAKQSEMGTGRTFRQHVFHLILLSFREFQENEKSKIGMIDRKYAKPAMEIVSVDVNIPYAFTKWAVDGGEGGGGDVIETPGEGGDGGWDPGNWGEND